MTRFEELLEGHLAGELGPEEEREFTALVAQEGNRRTLTAHQTTAVLLQGVGRLPLSPSFTEEVLASLSEQRSPRWATVWRSLWVPQTLRWNLASALALSLVLAATPLVWRAFTGPSAIPTGRHPEVPALRFTLHPPGLWRGSLVGGFQRWGVHG